MERTDPPAAETVRCPYHAYGEYFARGALARARLRGEERYMWHCPLADHWHVTDEPLDVLYPPHNDGSREGE